MSNGFIQLPRSLEKHPGWISAPLSHRNVFIYILYRSVIYGYAYKLGKQTIYLTPGQYASTTRRILDEYNTTVSRKDQITKSTMDRILNRFHEVGLWHKETIKEAGQGIGIHAGQVTGQVTGHECTIITQTYPDICEQFKKDSGTGNGTGCGKNISEERDTNREALASLPQILDENEQKQQASRPAGGKKILSILEGWTRDELLKPFCSMLGGVFTTCHTLSDVEFVQTAISYAKENGFTEANLEQLRDDENFTLETVILAIHKLKQKKDVSRPFGLLITICAEDDLTLIEIPKQKKQKLRKLPKRTSHDSNPTTNPEPPINPRRVHCFSTMDKISGTG